MVMPRDSAFEERQAKLRGVEAHEKRRLEGEWSAEAIKDWLVERLSLEGEGIDIDEDDKILVSITDDDFLVNKERIFALRDRITEQGLQKYYEFKIITHTLSLFDGDDIDAALVDALWDMGIRRINVGTDGLTQATIDKNNKGYTLDRHVIPLNKHLKEKGFIVEHNSVWATPQTSFRELLEAMLLYAVWPANFKSPGSGIWGFIGTPFNNEDLLANASRYIWDISDSDDRLLYKTQNDHRIPILFPEYALRTYTLLPFEDERVGECVSRVLGRADATNLLAEIVDILKDPQNRDDIDGILREWQRLPKNDNPERWALAELLSKNLKKGLDLTASINDIRGDMAYARLYSFSDYRERKRDKTFYTEEAYVALEQYQRDSDKMMLRSEWAELESASRELIEKHPMYSYAYYYLAAVLANQERLPEAIVALLDAHNREYMNDYFIMIISTLYAKLNVYELINEENIQRLLSKSRIMNGHLILMYLVASIVGILDEDTVNEININFTNPIKADVFYDFLEIYSVKKMEKRLNREKDTISEELKERGIARVLGIPATFEDGILTFDIDGIELEETPSPLPEDDYTQTYEGTPDEDQLRESITRTWMTANSTPVPGSTLEELSSDYPGKRRPNIQQGRPEAERPKDIRAHRRRPDAAKKRVLDLIAHEASTTREALELMHIPGETSEGDDKANTDNGVDKTRLVREMSWYLDSASKSINSAESAFEGEDYLQAEVDLIDARDSLNGAKRVYKIYYVKRNLAKETIRLLKTIIRQAELYTNLTSKYSMSSKSISGEMEALRNAEAALADAMWLYNNMLSLYDLRDEALSLWSIHAALTNCYERLRDEDGVLRHARLAESCFLYAEMKRNSPVEDAPERKDPEMAPWGEGSPTDDMYSEALDGPAARRAGGVSGEVHAATRIDPDKCFNQNPHFLAAVEYFNNTVLQAPEFTWDHAIELFHLFRGEPQDEELYRVRVSSAGIRDEHRDVMTLVNDATFGEKERLDVVQQAAEIYRQFYCRDPFFLGLEGFNKVEPDKPTEKAPHVASGHHRLSWFMINYFLINNGYEPFYLREGEDEGLLLDGHRSVYLQELLSERLRRSGTDGAGVAERDAEEALARDAKIMLEIFDLLPEDMSGLTYQMRFNQDLIREGSREYRVMDTCWRKLRDRYPNSRKDMIPASGMDWLIKIEYQRGREKLGECAVGVNHLNSPESLIGLFNIAFAGSNVTGEASTWNGNNRELVELINRQYAALRGANEILVNPAEEPETILHNIRDRILFIKLPEAEPVDYDITELADEVLSAV